MNKPQSLRDLVQLAVQRHRTSGRQLAMMAQREGFAIAVTTVNHLKAGTYKSTPSTETIRAIAWLAGVSDEVAFTAAGQPVPGPPLADELPPGTDNLSPKSRKAVIEMLRVLIDLEGSSHEHQEQAEANPSGERATREGGGRGGVGVGEKTGLVDFVRTDDPDLQVPPVELLAAHPDFTLDRDRFDEAHGKAGEESQAGPHEE